LSGPVAFTITYSNAAAITLTDTDVTLNATGTAAGDVSVSGNGLASRTVTVDNISGNGSLGISLAAGTATDVDGDPVPAAGPSDTFVVDNDAIAVSIDTPSVSVVSTGPVSYTVTYDNVSAVTLTESDVTLNAAGDADGLMEIIEERSGEDFRNMAVPSSDPD